MNENIYSNKSGQLWNGPNHEIFYKDFLKFFINNF